MTKEEILRIINENQACQLATVDGDRPRVRGMMCYRADEDGILFHTGTSKDLYKQIKDNPNVEICYFDPDTRTQIRVMGRAEIKKDLDLLKEIVEARPFMKPWVEEMGYEAIGVFQVTGCTAYTWTFDTNFAPKDPVKLS
ncbi:MAG: pyridoxamine 5'-phosphate oxidase family protein [Elusimicrobia bacterium]|nr:pyridoxamine 5'-phosphate oxidase family protein [Elusimicrobiota bacterium]